MSTLVLAAALLLDAALGEPAWLWGRMPHPVVLIGRVISWVDDRFNQDDKLHLKGILLVAGLSLSAVLIGTLLIRLPHAWLVEILVVSTLLAQRSLTSHVQAVGDALRLSLDDGRQAVSRIVGRETSCLDEPGVARAAIESAAENLSDGVVAPTFWYLVAGLPGLLLYKAINTADSMIGYRNERYREFGRAAARLDDFLNLVPARLTALLILIVFAKWPDWRSLAREAGHHASPNAGWPEAAMASVLGIALSGPRTYGGAYREFPYIHASGRHDVNSSDIYRSVNALWRVWLLILACALLAALPSFHP